MDRTNGDITLLLHAHASGDRSALDRVLPRVYDELRRLARARMRRERPGHTLGATELVHEAYLKLMPAGRVAWRDRAHFFAIAARAMRQVLVDHAVRRRADKRGAGAPLLSLDHAAAAADCTLDDVMAVNQALERLEKIGARQARVVECRIFGGLNLDETAAALHTSPATVSRDWTFARAWLHDQLARATAA